MTALFIRRPVMTALVMIGILFFGTVAYRRLPVSDLPSVDFPTISVNANLAGASPETMAAAVATPSLNGTRVFLSTFSCSSARSACAFKSRALSLPTWPATVSLSTSCLACLAND